MTMTLGTENTTPSGQIKKLLQLANHLIDTKKGTYLFHEGMNAEELFVVLSGKIQISKITSDGRELSLRICGENDLCGELTLFDSFPRYLLSALILEDGKVAVIKKDILEKELSRDNELAFEFMKWMSDHSRKIQTKFLDFVFNGKKGALYSTIIRMANSYGILVRDGIMIDLILTNQELANFCGTSRENTNRILNELKRKNIISLHKGKIIIHNLQYLKDESKSENYPASYVGID